MMEFYSPQYISCLFDFRFTFMFCSVMLFWSLMHHLKMSWLSTNMLIKESGSIVAHLHHASCPFSCLTGGSRSQGPSRTSRDPRQRRGERRRRSARSTRRSWTTGAHIKHTTQNMHVEHKRVINVLFSYFIRWNMFTLCLIDVRVRGDTEENEGPKGKKVMRWGIKQHSCFCKTK